MKKKFKLLFGFLCLLTITLSLSACANSTLIDEYHKKGYTVSVTYVANGGNFLNRDGVTVMDMFKPSDYEKGQDGKVHISLLEPTDPVRMSGSGKIQVSRNGYFLAGWYKDRTLRTNENGKPVDEEGVELDEIDGSYYYAKEEGEDSPKSASPAYDYDNLWNFSEDTLEYADGDGIVSLTLYAGWVPFYRFDYYCLNDNGKWIRYDSTSFDYNSTNAEGSLTSDKDMIWMPQWENGAVNYVHSYSDASRYQFPKPDNKTFVNAYLDEQKTQVITSYYEHTGTLDVLHAKAVNRVENIYVEFMEGNWYKIQTAEQLSANPDSNGIYEIYNDLDFGNGSVAWPAVFSTETFTGKIYNPTGDRIKISNVSVKFVSTSVSSGGLFARIAKGAEIKDIDFENITFDLSAADTKTKNGEFGLFSGFIESNADITGVTVSGATFKIGSITFLYKCDINLFANGSKNGITLKDKIKLQIYGSGPYDGKYRFTIDTTKVMVDDEKDVTLSYKVFYDENQLIDIEY